MTLSNAIATLGLNTKARPTSANTAGQIQIGRDSENVRLAAADVAYSWQALIVGAANVAKVDIETNDEDDVVTFDWVAGVAQVETATAAGTITAAGTATAIVTAAGLTGSPLTVTFNVALSDTAAQWAAKARTALAANAAIAAMFTVDGDTTAIRLTRKPTASYVLGTETIPVYPASDGTLNIALDNGTSTGITPAASSANTTAGTATDGVYAPDANGKDFEGNAIPADWDAMAYHAKVLAGTADITLPPLGIAAETFAAGEGLVSYKTAAAAGSVEFEAVSAVAHVSFTAIGKLQ